MTSNDDKRLTIVGAGLAGSLLAILLARQGWRIDVFERRGDPRVQGFVGGRSINLALAERGLHALRIAGTDAAVLRQAVMMRGRMVHFADGTQQLQRYGRDDSEVIWSVSRGELNIVLLDAAEAAGARIHFDCRLQRVDFDAGTAYFVDDRDDSSQQHGFAALIGADGAGSAVRVAMSERIDLGERFESLGHSYKELEIPPADDGGFQIEAHALHIWPRGRYMCIALPNDERTFTVTLFLPNAPRSDVGNAEDDPSFVSVTSGAQARDLFGREFADVLPLMPGLEHDFEHNPTGSLATLYLDRWHLDSRAVLLGDAAHAMVPFHGQGMNCAFGDCVLLADSIQSQASLENAFADFETRRLPDARAIQQMALENYLEMRDRVDDADFLLQRALERRLAERHPQRFVPRYAMVTFRRLPYALALQRGEIQRQLLVEATRGRETLDGIDWKWLDGEIERRLPSLPDDPK